MHSYVCVCVCVVLLFWKKKNPVQFHGNRGLLRSRTTERDIDPSNRPSEFRRRCGAAYLKAADIHDLAKESRPEMETRSPDTSSSRARDLARARDIPGNEIKKIANNSNPNCHGHIPRQTAIRSLRGRKRVTGRAKEKEREGARETTLQLLISMHHLDPRTRVL